MIFDAPVFPLAITTGVNDCTLPWSVKTAPNGPAKSSELTYFNL